MPGGSSCSLPLLLLSLLLSSLLSFILSSFLLSSSIFLTILTNLVVAAIGAVAAKLILVIRHDFLEYRNFKANGRRYFILQGSTELREPQKIEKLGETYLPYSVFLEYINGLGTSTFAWVISILYMCVGNVATYCQFSIFILKVI